MQNIRVIHKVLNNVDNFINKAVEIAEKTRDICRKT